MAADDTTGPTRQNTRTRPSRARQPGPCRRAASHDLECVGIRRKGVHDRRVSRILSETRPSPDDHFSRTPIARRLQRPTRKSSRIGPIRRHRSCMIAKSVPLLPYLVLLPVGFAEPGRSPGLLVSSYLAVSPLPQGDGSLGRFVFCGTFPTRDRAVGVTHHRALWSPDFPPRHVSEPWFP